jgi:hypothetical protein
VKSHALKLIFNLGLNALSCIFSELTYTHKFNQQIFAETVWCTYIGQVICLFDRFCLVLNTMVEVYCTESFTWDLILISFHFQLAGGTASMQQLKERLEKDLLEVYCN